MSNDTLYSFEDLWALPGVSKHMLRGFINARVENGLDGEALTVNRDGKLYRFYTERFREALLEFVTSAPPRVKSDTPATPARTSRYDAVATQAAAVSGDTDRLLTILSRDNMPHSIYDLADMMNISPNKVHSLSAILQQKGHCVTLSDDEVVIERQITQATTFVTPPWSSGYRQRFGVIADTHYGNKHAKLKSIQSAYNYFEEQGCAFVIHAGDIVDGAPSMHKGFEYELCLSGLDEQMDFVWNNHPRNLPTVFFGGNHDESWLKQSGYSVAWNLCQRADVQGLWHFGGDIDGFLAGPDGNPTFIYVQHPGGGSAYAYSWKAQKANEYLSQVMSTLSASLKQKGVARHPRFTFQGHYHKACYIPGHDGCKSYLVPASCDVTGFQRKMNIPNHTGAMMIDYTLDINGTVCRHTTEWLDYAYGDEITYTKQLKRTVPMVALWSTNKATEEVTI